MNKEQICLLCGREIIKGKSTTHHLIPVLKGGINGETVELHFICHSKIHSYFKESELRDKYNTIEKLLENNEIKKFVKWVSKKPLNFTDSNKQHRRKR